MLKAEDVKKAAHGRWDNILASVAPQLQPALKDHRKHVPCPVHGGTDGFRVFKDVEINGATVCNTCGFFTDGFATIMWANGWDFSTTLKEVARYVLLPQSYAAAPVRHLPQSTKEKVTDEEVITKTRKSLNDVWSKSIGCDEKDAEPARLYFARRGISIAIPEEIRFHKSLSYFDGDKKMGNFPALLVMISDVNGNPVTIHRTYLTKEGKKADVTSPKKMMPYPPNLNNVGSAIRFKAETQSGILLVAEGLETALAVMEGTNLPVWCTGNAHLLENFVPPGWAKQIFVFADKDKPSQQHPKGHGQEAATRLVQRIWGMGIKCSAIVPAGAIHEGEKSLDWLDILNQKGKGGFPSLTAIKVVKAA
jgi:phage/plasmid primase-like uncharacterized protein